MPKKDITSVSNWFQNNKNAILEDETQYITYERDLFAMVPKNKTPLRQLLEKSSGFRLFLLWRKRRNHEDETIHYISDQRIDFFVSLVITVLGLMMLIAPLWLLAFITDKVHRLEIITSFLMAFLCLISFATIARPFESLGATAA